MVALAVLVPPTAIPIAAAIIIAADDPATVVTIPSVVAIMATSDRATMAGWISLTALAAALPRLGGKGRARSR